jgi:hypothetical protein
VIRPLRQRHRRVTTGLALLLPLAYGAAILAREPEGTWELPPVARAENPGLGDGGQVVLAGREAWGGLPLEARFTAGVEQKSEHGVVELTPLEPLREPDLLVYWTSSEARDALPSFAVLLGRLGEVRRSWRLPHAGGYLTLFDLAHGELIASRPVPPVPAPGSEDR